MHKLFCQRNAAPPGMVPGGGPQGMMMHPGMMQAPGPMMPRKESIVDKLVSSITLSPNVFPLGGTSYCRESTSSHA